MRPNRTRNAIKWSLKSAIAFLMILASASLAEAQTIQTLCSFNFANGANPYAALTLGNDGNFYGMTCYGGVTSGSAAGYGTLFTLKTNGVLAIRAYFSGGNGFTHGANPRGALTLGNDGNFYGTTCTGGAGKIQCGSVSVEFIGSQQGSVFQLKTNGLFTTLYNLTDGMNPYAGLTLGNDGNFYGTTCYGGGYSPDFGNGTVFKVTGCAVCPALAKFNGNNGAHPMGALTLGNDGNFYGTASAGGLTNSKYSSGMGTVFKVTTNGTLTMLAAFNYTNGAAPWAELKLGNDGNFYGTTSDGGNTNFIWPYHGMGTLFKVTTNGTLNTLVVFNFTNGANPRGALTLGNDGCFYGTTAGGGITNSKYSTGMGTVFKVTTNGTLTTLGVFNFTNGAAPCAALTLGNDGNFYGTTVSGGSGSYGSGYGYGTVFRLSLSPASPSYNQISAQLLSGGSVRLSFVGMDGTNYALDRSFSLMPANWVPLVTNPAGSGGVLVFTNTPDPTTNNFWRIRSVP